MIELSILVGYLRKSKGSGAVTMTADNDALKDCKLFMADGGRKYYKFVSNAPKVSDILSGERKVTSITCLTESD